MNKIYLDNAGTTRVKAEVLEAMVPFFMSNESCKASIETVRHFKEKMKQILNASEYEVVFTSSGSEANNLAIQCLEAMNSDHEKRVLTTAVEHPAVLNTVKAYEKNGYVLTVLDVNEVGQPDLAQLNEWCKISGGFASMMYVNNEIGTILPVETFINKLHASGKCCHVDAVQALGHIKLDLDTLDVDFITVSAHKIHGPKGIGALLIKREHFAECQDTLPVVTDNMPYIAGFIKALELRYDHMIYHQEHMAKLRKQLVDGLAVLSSDIKVMGDPEKHVDAITNVMIPFMEGDSMVIALDMHGIAISSGSACSSGAMSASPVILALGYPEDQAKHCIRISMGDFTSESEIDRILEIMSQILNPYLEKENVK